jgi:hypothetical protein
VVLAGDYNVVPTDLDIYPTKAWDRDALLQPQSRAAYGRPPPGLRCRLRSGGDIQRPNQILQCVAATVIPMAKGISEATTIPIPIVLSLRANFHSALSDGRSRHSGSRG